MNRTQTAEPTAPGERQRGAFAGDNASNIKAHGRALVVGPGGSVGNRLVHALLGDGIPVRVVVRTSAQQQAWQELGVEARIADLAEPMGLLAAAVDCEIVYHCAGTFSHRSDPRALSWLHVAGTENLLRAAGRAKVRRLVILSCADVTLCDRQRIHFPEDLTMTERPLGAWARTKLLAEEVALQGDPDSALEVTAVRPGYLWGAGDRTNLPTLCREGLAGGIRLQGGGAQLFSVANLDNVVHGMRLAANAPSAPGRAYHLSDGEYETRAQFFAELSDACGLAAPRSGFGPLARVQAYLRGPDSEYPEWVRRGRACLLDMQRAITDLAYTPTVERADALAALRTYVQDQGGPAAVASQERKGVGVEVAQAFEQIALEGGSTPT